MPKVYNKYHRNAPPGAVYVGRPSVFGNPYQMNSEADRDTVCDNYELMVRNRPDLVAQIKRELRGKDLVCFCAPKRCHADTLLRIANDEEA
jgi:hypothetical protein